MWGLFIGIGLGCLQVFLLRKTAQWILGNSNGSMLAVFITLLKLFGIMGVLVWLAFGAGVEVMLWTAGAMLVTTIFLMVFLNIKKAKNNGQKGDK